MRNRSSLFFHSPFCERSDHPEGSQPVFLQFFLLELMQCINESKAPEKTPSPFYWTKSMPSYEKLKEHSLLLQYFFPSHTSQAREIEAIVQQEDKQLSLKDARFLFTKLLPFLNICKQNSPFIFFLLRHQKEINVLIDPGNLGTLLETLHPGGTDEVFAKICNYYQSNGYKNISTQVRRLTKRLS